MKHILGASALALAVAAASPAEAGRKSFDQNGSQPITATLSGYCDFLGDGCDDESAVILPYKVSIGGAALTDRANVSGNGLVTFGGAPKFWYPNNPYFQTELDGITNPIMRDEAIDLTALGLPTISAGQSNNLLWQVGLPAFWQSGRIERAGLGLRATWYTCYAPIAQDVCPESNAFTLTLTPTTGGFNGAFDFTNGRPVLSKGANLAGYVAGGDFTATGTSFFLPAEFEGLVLSPIVPEPATWATMVMGFGLLGAAMRRPRKLSQRAALG